MCALRRVLVHMVALIGCGGSFVAAQGMDARHHRRHSTHQCMQCVPDCGLCVHLVGQARVMVNDAGIWVRDSEANVILIEHAESEDRHASDVMSRLVYIEFVVEQNFRLDDRHQPVQDLGALRERMCGFQNRSVARGAIGLADTHDRTPFSTGGRRGVASALIPGTTPLSSWITTNRASSATFRHGVSSNVIVPEMYSLVTDS